MTNNCDIDVIATLRCARALLSPDPKEKHEPRYVGLGSLQHFEAFLDQNETELALDELIALGELNQPSHAYWRYILTAALAMNLEEQADTCRGKLAASSV